MILHLAVLIQHWSVTDRQTYDDGINHASIASHRKNESSVTVCSKTLTIGLQFSYLQNSDMVSITGLSAAISLRVGD